MKSDYQLPQLLIDHLDSMLNMINMDSPEELWRWALKNPVPLFLTVEKDPTLVSFVDSKLGLSKEAKKSSQSSSTDLRC